MSIVSYAQNFEDVMLWRCLRAEQPGFYVDVGAQHPVIESCTKMFYDRGWRGVNIEPAEAYAELLREARPRDVTLTLAAGAARGEQPFHEFLGTGLSTLDVDIARSAEDHGFVSRTRSVEVVSLDEILQAHGDEPFHFLKVDVEGAELTVLQGLDLRQWRPWILVVEAIRPISGELVHQAWEHLVLAADYGFAYFDGLNCYYLSHEKYEQLRPSFLTPPNVFDDFVRYRDLRIGICSGGMA